MVASYLVSQTSARAYHTVENMLGNVAVNRRQRVVQHSDVRAGIDGPGQTDPLLLSARQVYPALAYVINEKPIIN